MRNYSSSRSRGFRGSQVKSFGQSRPNRFGGKNKYSNKGSYINPLMFVKRALDEADVPYIPEHAFADFPLDKVVLNNIHSHGFDKPTAIQDQAMLPVLEGKDLVGIANTGTGKTAVFLLPMLTKVARDRSQRVLIVTPTRELAALIQDEFNLFSKSMGIYSTLCIGGASLSTQARQLSRQPNFVIGTPGRIMDLQKRRKLNLTQYTNVVLDEVDRMLDMGFINDIKHIISFLSKQRQSLFFSATLPEETKLVMQAFLRDPVIVSVKTGTTAKNVDQDIIKTRGKDKLEILHDLLNKEEFRRVLVFGRTKWGVNKLETNLIKRGFKAVAIHGNKSQSQRLRAINKLKNNEVQVLLATDVASRGIDIDDITHVINYDVPGTYDDYVHRIGRTGRAGKKGVALTFVD